MTTDEPLLTLKFSTRAPDDGLDQVFRTPHSALYLHDLSQLDTEKRVDAMVAIADELSILLRGHPNATIMVRATTPALITSIVMHAMEDMDRFCTRSVDNDLIAFQFAHDDVRTLWALHTDLPTPEDEHVDFLYVIKDYRLYAEWCANVPPLTEID